MDKVIRCPFCIYTFGSVNGLFNHKKKCHPNECSKLYPNFICGIDNECSQSFRFLKQYLAHLKSEHPNCDLNYKELTFDSIKEFNQWKDLTQSNTVSQYVQRTAGMKVKNGTLTTYFCNRNGNFKQIGTGERVMKAQQSRKTTKSCPASMFLLVDDTGSCNVQFYSKHIGHDLQPEHVDLTQREKLRIVNELKSCNYNKDIVLEKLDDTDGGREEKKRKRRIDRVDKKELDNIMRQFKLFDCEHLDVNCCDDDDDEDLFESLMQNIELEQNASSSSSSSLAIPIMEEENLEKTCIKNTLEYSIETLYKYQYSKEEIQKILELSQEIANITMKRERIEKRELEFQQEKYKKIKTDNIK